MTETLKLYPEIEQLDADRSFDQLLAAPPLRPMPLIVLSADHPWGPLVPGLIADGTLPPDIPPDFGYVTDRAAKEAQAKLAASVPGARHVTTPTAATRFTRTSRSSSSTRSAMWSTPYVPAGPSWRPDASAAGSRPGRCLREQRSRQDRSCFGLLRLLGMAGPGVLSRPAPPAFPNASVASASPNASVASASRRCGDVRRDPSSRADAPSRA